jgi:hypothetical protein
LLIVQWKKIGVPLNGNAEKISSNKLLVEKKRKIIVSVWTTHGVLCYGSHILRIYLDHAVHTIV